MHGPPPPPPLPDHWVAMGKRVLAYFAVAITCLGGTTTAIVAALDIFKALGDVFNTGIAGDRSISYAVKAVDALLLSLVQFLLGAYLWRMLDPRTSLIDEETVVALEEVKQMLCKVVLVILGVRLLDIALAGADALRWEHMVTPAGLASLALATSAMAKSRGESAPPAA
jgi:hypothetical protein